LLYALSFINALGTVQIHCSRDILMHSWNDIWH
jgi:hypothetical protein